MDPSLDGYFAPPESQAPLDDVLRRGLYAPAITSLISILATATLLIFLLYRCTTWEKHYRSFLGYNQYVILAINLLLADFLQSCSYVLAFHWLQKNAILAPSSACFAQGFLLNFGDAASGFFVMAIALHTFYTVVKGRRAVHSTLVWLIVCAWGFALIISIIGPIQHGQHYFVNTGAWCWAGSTYQQERLALQYIWIFIVQFGTIVIYVAIFFHLRTAMQSIVPALRMQAGTVVKVDRAAKLMILYPIFYIILTLPLSAGRMWEMAHHGKSLPNAYKCVAGACISSSGWVDALLYTLTRKTLLNAGDSKLIHAKNSGRDTGTSGNGEISLSAMDPGGITQTRSVIVSGHMLDHVVNDEEERGRTAKKAPVYHNFERPGHSPTGSLDPIISTKIDAIPENARRPEKGVKFATDTYTTEIHSQGFVAGDSSDDDKSVRSTAEDNTMPGGNVKSGFGSFLRSS